MAKAAVKTSKKKEEKFEIWTGVGRFNFVHLAEKAGMPGTPEESWKYSVNLAFDKNESMDVTIVKTDEVVSLKKALFRLKKKKFGPDKADWPEIEEENRLIQDGDSAKNQKYQGYPGHWIIKASNKFSRPGIVARDGKTVIDPNDEDGLYSGAYGIVRGVLSIWEFPANSGIYGEQLILDHVQKVKDGDKLGGGVSLSKAFKPFGEDTDDSEEEESEDADEEDNE